MYAQAEYIYIRIYAYIYMYVHIKCRRSTSEFVDICICHVYMSQICMSTSNVEGIHRHEGACGGVGNPVHMQMMC